MTDNTHDNTHGRETQMTDHTNGEAGTDVVPIGHIGEDVALCERLRALPDLECADGSTIGAWEYADRLCDGTAPALARRPIPIPAGAGPMNRLVDVIAAVLRALEGRDIAAVPLQWVFEAASALCACRPSIPTPGVADVRCSVYRASPRQSLVSCPSRDDWRVPMTTTDRPVRLVTADWLVDRTSAARAFDDVVPGVSLTWMPVVDGRHVVSDDIDARIRDWVVRSDRWDRYWYFDETPRSAVTRSAVM